jgi:hypothetical protein
VVTITIQVLAAKHRLILAQCMYTGAALGEYRNAETELDCYNELVI